MTPPWYAEPWYLEKVEVVLLSPTPLCWVAHYRGWIGGQSAIPDKGDVIQPASTPNGTMGGGQGLGNGSLPSTANAALSCVEIVPDPLAWEDWDLQVN